MCGMGDSNERYELTPCDVCKYRQTRSECFLCPHEPTPSWGNLETGFGCLIVAVIVLALLGAALG